MVNSVTSFLLLTLSVNYYFLGKEVEAIFGGLNLFFYTQMPSLEEKLQSIVFIDIITVRSEESKTLDSLPNAVLENAFKRFCKNDTTSPEEEYVKHAVFYPEFSKVIAIHMGMFVVNAEDELITKIHTIKSKGLNNEAFVINEFYRLIDGINKRRKETAGKTEVNLATFNGKRFDVPFLSKRSLVNGIAIPSWFQTQGVKPWDYPILDIQDSWDFGGRNEYTSLACMGYALGLNVDEIIPYNIYDERYHEHITVSKELARITSGESLLDGDIVLEGSQAELLLTMQIAQKLLSIQ